MIYLEALLFLTPLALLGLMTKKPPPTFWIRRVYFVSFIATLLIVGYSWLINVGLIITEHNGPSLLIGGGVIEIIDSILIVFLYLYIHSILT
ncbi:hypothetical protein OPW07_06605, partial [Vibrio europaeus]|uniref:hypothetical protein n=1 Tax=Vibrio europaeus TaxID=300876 RepID=UPI00233ED575